MRVGFDFDGVICDTIAAMIDYARATQGRTLVPLDCIRPGGPAGLDAEQFVRLVEDTHRTEYALRMLPVAGAIEALQQIARDHDLFIVTARREAAFENAKRWTAQFGLTPLIREFVSTAGRTKAAAAATLALDVLVDDLPQHLEQLPPGVIPVLWHASYNAEVVVVSPMVRVERWQELHEAIADARARR